LPRQKREEMQAAERKAEEAMNALLAEEGLGPLNTAAAAAAAATSSSSGGKW
jgi:hypothetical protein